LQFFALARGRERLEPSVHMIRLDPQASARA
jgi:hypothetical protein